MSAGTADAHIAVQYGAHVEQAHHRNQHCQPQNTFILLQHIGHQQEGDGRHQIAFMHHGTQGKQHGQQHRTQQRKMLCFAGAHIQKQHNGNGQRHQHGAHMSPCHNAQCAQHGKACRNQHSRRAHCRFHPQGLLFHEDEHRCRCKQHQCAAQSSQERRFILHVHPVETKEEVQIAAVDRSLRIIAHGALIQPEHPADPTLTDGERYHHQRHQHDHKGHPLAKLHPQRADFFFIPGAVSLHKSHHQRDQSQRSKHQGLGFKQHRRAVHRQRKAPLPRQCKINHQQQRQHHYTVHLPPGSARRQHQGIEKRQQRHRQCHRILARMLFCHTEQEQTDQQITQDGGHFHQQHIHAAKPVSDRPQNPQHQERSGRIIAKTAVHIETPRFLYRHLMRPYHKVVGIHIVAVHQQCQSNAQRKRQEKQNAKHGVALAGSKGKRLLPAHILHGKIAHHRIHQCCTNQRQIGTFAAFIRIGSSTAALCLIKHLFGIAVRDMIHTGQGHIVKPGLAHTFAAVSAKAHKHLQRGLVLAGSAVQGYFLPRITGQEYLIGIHVYAVHRQVGAPAHFRIGPDVAVKMVQGILLHIHFLPEAGVIQIMVADIQRLAAISAFTGAHLKIGIAGGDHIGVPAPILAPLLKSAVSQKVFVILLTACACFSEHGKQTCCQQ